MAENAKVLVRMRPLLKFQDQPAWIATGRQIKCMHSRAVKTKINKSHSTISDAQLQNYTYTFDRVVDSAVSSQKIYKSEIRQLVEKSLATDINSTIVAYGQTCSGKTFTLLGIKQAPGIIPCIFRDIFLAKHASKCRFVFKISYTEIYNEKLIDLLSPTNKELKIVKDVEWGNQIAGAMKLAVNCFEECLQVLDKGESNRKYGEKENHERSSRSHTIIKIYIEKYDQSLACKRSTINVVDLAGSQRLSIEQQFSNNKETGHINKSLFQFSSVISKLSEGKEQHIPYRDSKLTRLLQNSLTVQSNLFIIFCISPAVLNFNESVSTLRLATKAKKVQLQNQQTEDMDSHNIKQLQHTLKQQSLQIKRLKDIIKQLSKQIQKMSEEKICNNDNKQKKVIQIKSLILLDHQNFMISVNNRIHDIESVNSKSEVQIIKNQLIENLTQIYEQYSKKIINIALKQQYDANWLKVEDVCFASMLYDTRALLQYRIPLLEQVCDGLHKQDNQFATLLQAYIQQMQAATNDNICKSNISNNVEINNNNNANNKQNKNIANNNNNVKRSNYSSVNFNSNNKRISPQSNYCNESPILQQSQIELIEDGTHKTGSMILAWGCSKDGRVYKSHQQHKNHTKNITVKYDKLEQLVEIECGAHHSLAVTKDGEVWGWGKNDHNQILNNKQTVIANPQRILVNGIKIKQVAAGWAHSLLLSTEGNIYSYGYGKDGQLGHGTIQSKAEPTRIQMKSKAIAIYAGHSHSGFIDTDNNYYSFGFNKDYRLMTAESKQVQTPTKINIKNVRKAALGVSHSCLLTKGGKVYCGGVGTNGELGVDLNPTITGYQTIALHYNTQGLPHIEKVCPLLQLQYANIISNNNNIVIDISCGQFSTAIITASKQLYTFGKASYDRLGHNQTTIHKILQNVDNVKMGYRHGFAWNSQTKEVYGWGFNMYNQLGTLQHRDIKIPQLLQEISTQDVLKIATGFFHSAAIAL